MTNEDAIADIRDNIKPVVGGISLDMAIKALEQQSCEDAISRERTMLRVREFIGNPTYTEKMLVDDLNALPSVIPKEKTDWIPVSERLPEEFRRVLLTVMRYNGNKVVRVAEYYGKNTFHVKETNDQWKVGEKGLLAWMPLPEPYKAESEE